MTCSTGNLLACSCVHLPREQLSVDRGEWAAVACRVICFAVRLASARARPDNDRFLRLALFIFVLSFFTSLSMLALQRNQSV